MKPVGSRSEYFSRRCGILLLLPLAAAAQGPEADAGRGELPRLEEIVVTATKRAVLVQEVPMSISVLSDQEIEDRGLRGMDDYLAAVPGVSYIEGNTTSNAIVIRGVETAPSSQNFGSGTTVATYFGETPITNSSGLLGGSGLDLKLFDIERIEVLRGPQGTAFGNSSLGGAVRTIPKAPVLDEVEGTVAANYSHTGGNGGGNHMVQGAVNLPVAEGRLALRAVGYRLENSGVYRNIAGSDPAMQAYAASLGPQALSLAIDENDAGSDRQTGGRIAFLWRAGDDLDVSLSYLYQKAEQDGFKYTTSGYDYSYVEFRMLPEYTRRGSGGRIIDNHIGIANATIEYALGWADVVSSLSWLDSGMEATQGGAVDVPYSFDGESPHDSFTGEIRLVSSLDGPWQFLAGVYHEELDDRSVEHYRSVEEPASSPYGDGVNVLLGLYEIWRDLEQDAVFGEVSYDLTDRLTATIGGRAYRYDRSDRLESSGWFAGTALGSPNVSRSTTDDSGTIFKANLTYDLNENSMLYTSWSEGFRLGRPTAGLIPAICDVDSDGFVDGTDITIESTRHISSDTLENFEVGGKFSMLDSRLIVNPSVYYIDWTGLPTNARAECGAASYFYVANAGEASSRGFEIQTSWYASDNLRVDLGGSYTDAELSVDVPTLGAESGDRLPGSPRTIVNLGLQLDGSVAGYPAFLRADSHYRGSFFGDLSEDPLTEAGGYVRVDARFGLAVSETVDVEVFVTNLTDVDEYVWRGLNNSNEGFGYLMRPRTVGVQVDYNF